MHKTRTWQQFDLFLLVPLLILVALGVAMINSANLDTPDLADMWRRQATFAIYGFGLFFLAAALPYHWLRQVWWLGYLLALAALILVLFFGESEIGDVRRWFYLGEFRLQPSFPALLLHIVAMAAILSHQPQDKRLLMTEAREQSRPGLRRYLFSGVMAFVLAGLVFREPDMSTAVIFVVVWAAIAFVSRVRMPYLLATGVLGLISLIPLWEIMEEYQKDRVMLFVDPSLDPERLYNMDQALMSIGSGGLWGQGYAVGSQSQLHFLRVRHTDFIFSVLGEELGFIGSMMLLALFALLAWRLLRAALVAPDTFGQLIVVGVGAVIFFPLVVNVGMNVGLLPVTGLPLPFFSYGGSALVTYMTAMGLAAGVAMRYSGK